LANINRKNFDQEKKNKNRKKAAYEAQDKAFNQEGNPDESISGSNQPLDFDFILRAKTLSLTTLEIIKKEARIKITPRKKPMAWTIRLKDSIFSTSLD